MISNHVGTNTLYYDIECPHCNKAVRSGIGFRVGGIRQLSYRLGEQLKWEGAKCRPDTRPPDGNIQTIGYFNCDNPRCDTWKDCFPEIQEALIIIKSNVIMEVRTVNHKPEEHNFDIIEQA